MPTINTTIPFGPLKVLVFHSEWGNVPDRLISAGESVDESKDGERFDSDPMAENHGTFEVRTLTPSQRLATLFKTATLGMDGAGAFTFYRTNKGQSYPVASTQRYPDEYKCFPLPLKDAEYLEAYVLAGKRPPGRPAEVEGGKTRRLYAGESDWQWLTELGDGEPSAGLRKARATIDLEKCPDCGEPMKQEPFPYVGSALDPAAIPEATKALWDQGLNDEGEVWIRCPNGHRGGWRAQR